MAIGYWLMIFVYPLVVVFMINLLCLGCFVAYRKVRSGKSVACLSILQKPEIKDPKDYC